MNYRVEWIAGGVVYGTLLLLLIVPELAFIALLVVAIVTFAALVALAAAVLASPYLLARSLRRRRDQPTTHPRTRWIHSPSAIPLARSLHRPIHRRAHALRPAAVHHGATQDRHRART